MIFLFPLFGRLLRRRVRRAMPVLRHGMILLLAYLMLIEPDLLGHQAPAATDYSNLTTANWNTSDRDIHYQYDENGSCTLKVEAVKDTADWETNFLTRTVYFYNLQNRLEEVGVTTNGVNGDTTTYEYDDHGIRVEKDDNGTVTTYLIDR